ncbi:MAG: hypothetical protein K6F54_10230 [Lachnospiraceae bacterium]|nr:hypothetical protein [Lachnospiraceae bacterium]
MSGNKNMQFGHSYMTKDKMKSNEEGGVFSSKFKSYIADGESALRDKIMGEATRESVMQDVRRNLRQQMSRVNDRSYFDAMRMQSEHQALRARMQEALVKAKDANRQKKLLEARLLAEKSKQSNFEADISENELDAIVFHQQESVTKDMEDGVGGAGNTTREDFDRKVEDMQYYQDLKEQATANRTVTHHKNMFSLFRAIGKKMTRDGIEDEMARQDQIISEQQQLLRFKGREWSQKRKTYEKDSYRQYYNEFDRAAARYRVLNRRAGDAAIPLKDVKEYVGEFDMDKLEDTLTKLEDNPYLDAQVDYKNKKEGRSNAEEDLIKSHSKITLMGEEDETGFRKRYKISSDFSFGYEAKRQFSDKDHPTALIGNKDAFEKVGYTLDRLKLQTDEKDASGKFINSEDNLEIVQAKQKKWFGAKTLNGIFLDGEFLSTDFLTIKGLDDAKLTSGYSREDAKTKEYIRRQVLKANVFREINSKTIQHAMGYGASGAAMSGAKSRVVDELAKRIMSEKGLADWDETVDTPEIYAAEFFEQVDGEKADRQTRLKNNKELLEKNKEAVEKRLFSKEYDKKLLDPANLDKGHKLVDPIMDIWEKKLIGDDEEAKKSLPTAVKTKVAYDVLRQEYVFNKDVVNKLGNTQTRAGRILNAIKDDRKALTDVALMLLADDVQTDYWNMAKFICTNTLMTNFEKKVEGRFDSRFNRALAKGRDDQGMLMRIALIDELNANRSHWDPLNMFNAMMPTRWKQYTEDLKDQRGTKAIVMQKLTDGTVTGFINDVFSTYIDINDGFGTLSLDTLRDLGIVSTYTSVVSYAIDMGALTEAGAFAIGELFGDDIYITKDKKGKDVTNHTSDDRRTAIGFAFTMFQNLIKIVKLAKKSMEKAEKEAKQRMKKDPSYDPKEDLAFTQDSFYSLMVSATSTAFGISSAISKFVGAKELKSIFAMGKSMISTIEDGLAIYKTTRQVYRIEKTQNELTALENKENKTQDDEVFLGVLEKNSQLQYGLACAKRKNRDERAGKIVSLISNAGKSALNFVKVFFPGGKKNPVFIVADAAWGALMTGASTVTEVVRHKMGVKANVEKMIGKSTWAAPTSVLNDVLRREAGIYSIDYLTDLARIFMSIDTDVFMKEASTREEKIVGAKIAQTLFNNKAFNEGTLKKMNVNKLMGVMGVKGNFRGILKHSLA